MSAGPVFKTMLIVTPFLILSTVMVGVKVFFLFSFDALSCPMYLGCASLINYFCLSTKKKKTNKLACHIKVWRPLFSSGFSEKNRGINHMGVVKRGVPAVQQQPYYSGVDSMLESRQGVFKPLTALKL